VGNTTLRVTIIEKLSDLPFIDQSPLLFCQNCGKEITHDPCGLPHIHVVSGDLICSECRNGLVKEPELKHTITCCGCGRDVSSKAKSDGKAEELKEIALYYCQQCASSEQKRVPVKKIGNYYIIKELGEGGFGIVFLAWHQKTGRISALKLTREKIKKDAELIKRFKREIAVMKKLSHRNLVKLYDEGISETDNYYLISEYLPEGSLTDLINDQFAGKMPYRLAISIFIQALEGLSYFHKKGFIHRDMKPENMLLRKDNNGYYVVKTGDFGLSKSYVLRGGTITNEGEFAGTLFYCAPEQIFNFKDVKPQADIYSTGMALYFAITGEYPYDFPARKRFIEMAQKGQRPREPIDIILSSDKPIPIEKKMPNIPVELAKTINKSIEKDVSKRFQSAEEFKNALLDAL
jgi:serine/threonine-protein kinase